MHACRFAFMCLVIGELSLTACSESSGPPAKRVTTLRIKSGDNQEALAGSPVAQPILIIPADESGTVVHAQTATFTVVAGGGSVSSPTAQAGPDGTITAPSWTLGRNADAQALQVSTGDVTTTVHATVHSELKIDLRLFGEALTADQQSIFTDAVARLRAIIVGSVPVADLTAVGSAPCAVSELPAPGASTDGIVIYAGAKYLDGINRLLGVSWTCNKRSPTDARTAIGIVFLDMADINLTPDIMRVVALHEMLHAFGFGTSWQERNLLAGFDTDSVSYHGAAGIAGCLGVGGTKQCGSGVPVQNFGGPSIANTHWRDTVFGEELMTSRFKTKPLLSAMTIRSLEDLGYVVNPLAADPYGIPATNIFSNRGIDDVATPWESNRLPLRERM
jgi:hypothetical protein